MPPALRSGTVSAADVSFARLPPPVLTALLDGDLATAAARVGVALPPCFLEEARRCGSGRRTSHGLELVHELTV